MNPARDRAAVLALLQVLPAGGTELAARLEAADSVERLLQQTLGDTQTTLFGTGAPDPDELITAASRQLDRWTRDGIGVLTVRDREYPANLREVHDRPAVLFIAGRLAPADQRSVAVIGSRRASHAGRIAAATFAGDLVGGGFTVISGLAAGVDTAAHEAARKAGGRTIAVIGTGLHHTYPAANRELQARLAREHAVVSQFWPDAPPRREAFPERNATMSGLSRATVIIEATERSGARGQARRALAHGRPVFLYEPVADQAWARELAGRPNVRMVATAAEVIAALDRLDAGDVRDG